MKAVTYGLAALIALAAPAAAEWSIIVSGHWLEQTGEQDPVGELAPGESEIDFDFDAGAGVGVGLLWEFSETWAIEAKGSWAQLDGLIIQTLPDAVFILKLDAVDVVPITAVLQWRPDVSDTWHPYLGLGGGYLHFTDTEILGDGGDVEFDGNIGLVAAGGFDYGFSERWFLNFDVKYIPFETGLEGVLPTGERGETDFEPVLASAGVRYRF
ncbi:MAG: OmpW/AlkL family protein [Thermoanaerobaculia bacterium]